MRLLALITGLTLAACGQGDRTGHAIAPHDVVSTAPSSPPPLNVYAQTNVGALSPEAARARPLVYVPNSKSDTVTEIDPKTLTVLRTFPTGKLPQHVVPSFDMTTLWVTNDEGNSLTRIDPTTGADGERVPVADPYNLYFSPDGKLAMVIAEALHRFDLRDPKTMKLIKSVRVECDGLDHVDFTGDDRYAIATCEFSGQLVKLDMQEQMVVGYLKLKQPAMPQDIRSSPDARTFYVADMMGDGIHVIDAASFTETGFIKTGKGTHGFVVGHGGQPLYIMNRGWNTLLAGKHGPGSITVFDPVTQKIEANWPVPDGGSPDMGDLSTDGTQLWVSGRYDREVYAFDTRTGALIKRIPVGVEPHGLCYWPQPGRFSLGHTGNMR